MIPFKNMPQGDAIRVPLYYTELDNSKANTATQPQRALLIGQLTAAGVAPVNAPVISQGPVLDAAAFGPHSMLASMISAWRKNDTTGEVWGLPVADAPSAVASQGGFTFTHVATANGTEYFYVGNTRYALPVVTTQTTTDLATALAALINADVTAPVTASAATNTVTLTAVNAGTAANDIQLRVNYIGPQGGEPPVAGLAVTTTQMTGGTLVPSLTTALANLGDRTFDFIVCPYDDTTSLQAMAAFMSDQTGRWSYQQGLYGHVFCATRGTLSQLVTTGNTLNNQHLTMFGFQGSPTPKYLWAAGMAAACAVSLRADPALPLQTVVVQGLIAPVPTSRFPKFPDRNTLLFNGISTFTVGDDFSIALENVITSYQTNGFGQADNSYLQVETLFTLMLVLRDLGTVVTSDYARKKLAADGTRFGPGANVVTPSTIKGGIIANYSSLEKRGYVQGSAAFAQGLIVEQDSQAPSRVNVLWDGYLIDGLRIFALLAQFRLQVPS